MVPVFAAAGTLKSCVLGDKPLTPAATAGVVPTVAPVDPPVDDPPVDVPKPEVVVPAVRLAGVMAALFPVAAAPSLANSPEPAPVAAGLVPAVTENV